MKEFIRLKGLRREDDDSPVTPPEVRFFDAYYPSYLREQERIKREREESERRAIEARESSRRREAHKRLMRDMREWGPKNGFFVGTRGRIPRKVIDAYKEAKG
ncbi:histone-like nucleoid-structuring protein Lsr2 [Streptomyces sp. NPDC056696]|uniref:Lsr2 family DNA-binding protein n=1 Tax=unclassified Streptomyces TaxID=2593676 RepID=UPI00365A6492